MHLIDCIRLLLCNFLKLNVMFVCNLNPLINYCYTIKDSFYDPIELIYKIINISYHNFNVF
ncbi:hypothetical protein X975_07721, partial [Stegodyphus mimosarum]